MRKRIPCDLLKINCSCASNSCKTIAISNLNDNLSIMVIAKILSVQEELLNSSIINLKPNNSDSQRSIHSIHQMQQQYSTEGTSLDFKIFQLLN